MADKALTSLPSIGGYADIDTGDELYSVVSGNSRRVHPTFKQAGSGATVRLLNTKLRDSVHVKDFGAVGDGTTNDGDAIRAAATASAASGIAIDFSDGRYKLDKYWAIPSNACFFARPGTATIYIPTTIDLTGAASFGGSTRSVYNANYASSDTNIFFDGIDFEGDGASQTKSTSLAFNSVTGFRFLNGRCTNFGNATYYNTGLQIFASSEIKVIDCEFSDCSGDGIALSSGCSKYEVVRNIAENNDDCGIVESIDCFSGLIAGNRTSGNVNGGIVSDRCYDSSILDNKTGSNGYGIRIYQAGAASNHKRLSVRGNISTADTIGISAEECVNSVISANLVSGSTGTAIQAVGTQGCVISGNEVKSAGTHGILLNVFSGQTCQNNIVVGNLTDGGTYGVRELNSGGTLGTNTLVENTSINASTANYSTVSSRFNPIAEASVARTTLGVAIGTDVQAFDQALEALSDVTPAANKLAYYTDTGNAAVTDFTAYARTLLDDTGATHARTTLGLGTAATYDVDDTGGNVAILTNANVWTGLQKYTNIQTDFEYTDDAATGGPNVNYVRLSASPAASDILGIFSFWGKNASAATVVYGRARCTILDTTAGAHDGAWELQATINGTVTTLLTIGPDVTAAAKLSSTSPTAGVGYSTGAGGTVTQSTNKSTAVTLDKVTGLITMNNAALAAATIVSFTLNDSAIAATDLIVATHESGGTTGAYTINARATGAGTAAIDVRNNTAGSLSEAIVIRFAVIKSVSA